MAKFPVKWTYLICLLVSLLGIRPALGEDTRVAVAANFIEAAREIGNAFEAQTNHRVRLSFGATGQLYAQITHGAPFDIFLAADRDRPKKAVEHGLAAPESLFTYAVGRLALYSPEQGLALNADSLRAQPIGKIAIANPATAPYGAAAVAALRRLDLYELVQGKIVMGANVAQAFQFVHTGNADFGIIALAQLSGAPDGSYWVIPDTLHPPIAQDAVLLRRGATNPAALAFFAFLKGPTAAAIMARRGYDTHRNQQAVP